MGACRNATLDCSCFCKIWSSPAAETAIARFLSAILLPSPSTKAKLPSSSYTRRQYLRLVRACFCSLSVTLLTHDPAMLHSARVTNRGLTTEILANLRGMGSARGLHHLRNAVCRDRGVLSVKMARFAVNEAGFDIPVPITPEEAERSGQKPYGDGGVEDDGTRKPKVYTHGPCACRLGAQFVVSCENSQRSPSELASDALSILRLSGFVVLENLIPAQNVRPLEQEAARFLDERQDGIVPQPLRAGRTEGHLPYASPWASSWLLKNSIVLEVAARYLDNHLAAGRTQDEQQLALVQWLTEGAHLDWFRRPEVGPKPGPLLDSPPSGCSDVGTAHDRGPFFGRISLIKTPPGSPGQKRHRDISHGPGAQLTIQTPLTPLLANNGPLAYIPGSHCANTPGYEVVANPPLGSVVVYDSFSEHRGIENHGSRDRYAIYYYLETRGVFSGYTDTHFGAEVGNHMRAFRAQVDPDLRRWVDRRKLESSQ
eukprot:TRINITY_DN35255_c0_g1_i1.p1 TRINITY_DN35255_c0_g1~~TRINITY_DN35255_c0_g1_i1.p1  ORF type:complete len:484 (+),score=45.08 TRINITY_DN35255_c0_g1_i1:326-1777(+)